MNLTAVRRRWSTYRLHFSKLDRRLAISNLKTYVHAMNDVITDLEIIIPVKERTKAINEALLRVRQNRDHAKETLDMFIFDHERDVKDGEIG